MITAETAGSLPASTARAHPNWVTVALAFGALWLWAMAGCLDEWQDNPMYSYGWFVPPLMLFFAWRRLDEPFVSREPFSAPVIPSHRGLITLVASILAILVLPAELLRNELPDDRLNNWTLAAVAVGCTLWLTYCLGGKALLRTWAFPILFFFTAVAWPKRYEIPVTIGLQKFVTDFVVEVMYILGIHANPEGSTIYLRNGPVGIAEACSGIRSLQASLMISLAIGELFYLRLGRRLVLIVLSAFVATLLNLGRTLSLCLLTEYRGADAMHKAHDMIGNTILLILPLLCWGVGRLLVLRGGAVPSASLPRRPGPDGTPPPTPYWRRLWTQARSLPWDRMPNLAPVLAVGIASFSTYHVWLYLLDLRDPPQQAGYFTVRSGADVGLEPTEMSSDVWAALTPSSGGYYMGRNPIVPNGHISLYHFFWKPAAANRWVTGHRPDICMPAGGWTKDGDVQPIEVDFNGHKLGMTLFRFASVGQRAIQLWGIWRNGQSIEMDFFQNPTLEWSLLTGRSRSAVEVLSCVVPYTEGQPPVELARQFLRSAFEYKPASHPGTSSTSAATP